MISPRQELIKSENIKVEKQIIRTKENNKMNENNNICVCDKGIYDKLNNKCIKLRKG